MKEQDKITFNINDPAIDPTGSVFTIKLEMFKSNTLLELKQQIGSILDLDINQFTVRRYMVQRELKKLDAKLNELGLINGANLRIELG